MPTENQIIVGNEIAGLLFDAGWNKAIGGLDLAIPEKYSDIVNLYLDNKIDSVTGIYMAMSRCV